MESLSEEIAEDFSTTLDFVLQHHHAEGVVFAGFGYYGGVVVELTVSVGVHARAVVGDDGQHVAEVVGEFILFFVEIKRRLCANWYTNNTDRENYFGFMVDLDRACNVESHAKGPMKISCLLEPYMKRIRQKGNCSYFILGRDAS